MRGCEAADEAVDAKAAHRFVAEPEAREGVAAHDEPPALNYAAVLVDGKGAGPEWFAGAASEDAEVVCVLEILGKHDIADVQHRRELRDGEVPDAPGVLHLVGDSSVKDEAPPRVGGFVDRTEWFDEEREGAVARDQLGDALPGPCGELGPECDFGGLVAFPAGVVWSG